MPNYLEGIVHLFYFLLQHQPLVSIVRVHSVPVSFYKYPLDELFKLDFCEDSKHL